MINTAPSSPGPCTVTVDSFRCNACGACVEMAPDNFTIAPATGKAREIASPVARTADLERAAAFCPRKCITLEDEA